VPEVLINRACWGRGLQLLLCYMLPIRLHGIPDKLPVREQNSYANITTKLLIFRLVGLLLVLADIVEFLVIAVKVGKSAGVTVHEPGHVGAFLPLRKLGLRFFKDVNVDDLFLHEEY